MLDSLLGSIRRSTNARDIIFTLVIAVICVVLYQLPTGFDDRLPKNITHAMGEVLETNNDQVFTAGLVRQGEQSLVVRIKNGPFADQEIEAHNLFIGKLELDAFFQKGDRALLNLSIKDGKITSARAVDHYRLDIELWLFVGFSVLLVLICGWTGARSLLSFVFTALMIWKVLVPCYLQNYDPLLIGAAVTASLSTVIVLLVGGVRKRGFVAVLGSLLGLSCALGLSVLLSGPFNLNGTVRPFSETLLYSGFEYLDLKGIFLASVFLAASGAMMDLAMDLAASMGEVIKHNPGLSRWKLFMSGLTISRAVTGTMTTTLLLAYSGGYVTMLMYFMGTGVPLANCLNLTYVSSEILYTLVGSFSLVATGPFTAIVATFMYSSGKEPEKGEEKGEHLGETATSEAI